MSFTLHTKETAPEKSQPLLDNALEAFGMIPNLIAVMAEAPATLEAYQTLHSLFQQTSFDAEELTVVWQTINVEHECHYCVPAHTAIAHMMKVDAGIIDALRNKTDLPTEKLQVLRRTTLALVKNRGRLAPSDVQAFKAVGYENKQLLEIVLGISQKVISNYTNHLAETPVDEPFKQFV
ncbi:carboxymuconolactone decarboxylase [Kiloniella litopenaei]|uniref:Carboxymuconolactone decarboxylase n=1 Tax=Kiloniella litopenaei TaxID=1549748 RepID=A0A0M2RGM2_9PROT|nr:carboxymuconolactone decarboxylase family protein [Kiloniella litopenaei]KKJ78703.1 carboxymuconolactone decarboxylase [Kiloniella litopenaei]